MDQKTTFTLLTGIAGSGKTAALLELYRDALRQSRNLGKPGTALWLSPTNRAQAEVRSRLLDDSLGVVFRPNLFTFDQFADEVLKAAPQPVAPCSAAMQRVLLRRVVTELAHEKRLRHFQQIANTSGFLDLVSAFIAELKRSETWPEHFATACAKRGHRAADSELELIYTRYQQVLREANVYDGEGRFWSARTALADGHWGRFADLSLAVIDGFTDFTEAQFKILALVARHVERTYVSLLHESSDERSDLFAKTAAVIKRLNELGNLEVRRFPQESRRQAPAMESAPPERATTMGDSLSQIARQLFMNPRKIVCSPAADEIEVVAVAGRLGEIRYLAARIKQLLLNGVAADDIVVAVRDLDDYAVLIKELFTAGGIPFASEAGLAGSRLAPARALVNLLSLEAEDWPFERLMVLLDSGYFQPDWSEFDGRRPVRDVSAELRRRELAEGREQMLQVLEPDTQHEASEDANPSDARKQRAWRLLSRLSQALAELRCEHDLAGWSRVIATLIREIGMDRAPLDEEASRPDRTFGDFLTSILFDAARGEQLAGMERRQLGLTDFLSVLTDLLDHQRLPPCVTEAGRVRVLSAEQVRNLDVPYLFLPGLTETSFPRHRSDDCLYSERDRQELNSCGLALGHRALRSQEELLMFYGIVTRSRRRLVMTYPKSTEDGQPLSCSTYLTSVFDLFDKAALKEHLEEQLDPVPRPDRVVSPADCRVRGMADALAGQPGGFRAVCDVQRSARHCLTAIDMNVWRFHTAGFTNYEGLLENPRNVEWIQNRFSPEHEFSATQLEAYAECPFKFLIGQVLKLEPPAEPRVDTDFARRGSLVHELLAAAHRELSARQPPVVPRGEEIAAKFRELLEARLKTHTAGASVRAALERIEQRLLAEWGDAYGRQWDDYVAGLPRGAERPPLPAMFEVAFGAARPAPEQDSKLSDSAPGGPSEGAASCRVGSAHRSLPLAVGTAHPTDRSVSIPPAPHDRISSSRPPASLPNEPPPVEQPTYPALTFGTGNQAVQVGGRIDRIDLGLVEGRPVFTVIDYKTGRAVKGKIDNVDSGRSLQLELYAHAVAQLGLAGADASPWQMGYWYIRETGFVPGIKTGKVKPGEPLPRIAVDDWSDLVTQLNQTVVRLASGIRSGSFPVYNEDKQCTSGCPYSTICRVAQIRAVQDSLTKLPRLPG